MRYYETLYIVHPDYEEDRLMNVKQDVDQWVSKQGGQIANSYVWGKRKLAYSVDKHHYGTYMLLNYGTEKPLTLDLNNWMELHEAILAYLTIQLDEEPVAREEPKAGTANDLGKKNKRAKENVQVLKR